jgi:arabinofuranosyltransferase
MLIVVLWAVSCALWFRVPYAGALKPGRIADERGFYVNHSGDAHPIAASAYADIGLGQFGAEMRALAESNTRILELQSEEDQPIEQAVLAPLASTVPPTFGAVGIRTNIGISGYVAGPHVWLVDRLGLADPIAARLALSQRGRPGHEKWLPDAWYLGRFADPAAQVPQPEAVAAARQALGCGELRALMQAVEQPMSTRRFLRNLRLAWTLRDLQIPDDPTVARAQFCASH